MGIEWKEIVAATFKHFGATLSINSSNQTIYTCILVSASLVFQIWINNSISNLTSSFLFLDSSFGLAIAVGFILKVLFLIAFTVANIAQLKQPLNENVVYEAGHLDATNLTMDLYLYAYLYKCNYYLTGPLMLGIGISHAAFDYPLFQDFSTMTVWMLVGAGFLSFLLNIVYLVFLQTYLPTGAWESTSTRLTSWLLNTSLLSSTVLNAASVYYTKHSTAQQSSWSPVVLLLKAAFPVGGMIMNLTATVTFSRSNFTKVLNCGYTSLVVIAFYQHLKGVAGIATSATITCLFGALALKIALNLSLPRPVSLSKDLMKKLPLDAILNICEDCLTSREYAQPDTPAALNCESYIATFENQNHLSFTEMLGSLRGDKKLALVVSLLSNFERYDLDKNFYSNAYCLHYLVRMKFDLHRVALLLNSLRSTTKDLLQQYTFYLLETFVQEHLKQYYLRKEMSDMENREFYDASSLSQRESSRSNTPRANTGRTKLWLGDEVISYKFVRSIILYEKFVKNMSTVTDMISKFYDKLTQSHGRIDSLHLSVKQIVKSKKNCDNLFGEICEALEHQRLAGFHFLPYAKFLSDLFNEHEKSFSMLKKWRQVAKYRFQTLKDAGELEDHSQSVILLVDTQQKSLSSVLYATHNSLQVLKVPHQNLVGISINELLGKELQEAHQLKINELNRNIFDLNYLNKSQERFISIPALKPIYSRCIVAVDFIPSITAGIRYIASLKTFRQNERDSYLVLNKNHLVQGIGQGLIDHPVFSTMHQFLGQHVRVVDGSLASMMNKYRKVASVLRRTGSESNDDVTKPGLKGEFSLVLPGTETQKGVMITPLGMDGERRGTTTKDLMFSKTFERNIQEIPLNFETSPGVFKEIFVSAWIESSTISTSDNDTFSEYYVFINVATDDLDHQDMPAALESPRILDQLDPEPAQDISVYQPGSKEPAKWQISMDGGSRSGKLQKKYTKAGSQSSKHKSGAMEMFKTAKLALQNDLNMIGKGVAGLIAGKKASRLVGYKEVEKQSNSAHHDQVDVASISSAASSVHKKGVRTLFSSVRKKRIVLREILMIISIQLCFIGISIAITMLMNYLFEDIMGSLILSRKISRPSYWMGLDAKLLGNNIMERMLLRRGLINTTQERFSVKGALTRGIVPTYEEEFYHRKASLEGIVLKWLNERLSLKWRDGSKFFLYTETHPIRFSSNATDNVTLKFDTEGLISLLMQYVNIWQKDFLTGNPGFDTYYINDYATLSWAKWDRTNSRLISAILVLDSDAFSQLNASLYNWIAGGVGVSSFLALMMLLSLYLIRRKILSIYSIYNKLNGYEISFKKDTLIRFKEMIDTTTDLVERYPQDFMLPMPDLRLIKTIQRRSVPKSNIFTCFGMMGLVISSFLLMQVVNVFGFVTVNDLTERSKDKLYSMYILRIHQRFVVCSANIDNKAFMVVLNKAGLKKQSVNLTADLTVIRNCATELDTNINIITNYSSQRMKMEPDLRFSMHELYTRPMDNFDWRRVKMTEEEIERMGSSTMNRDYVQFHRWQILNMQNIHNNLVKLGNGTAALKYFDDPGYLEFAFITRHFMTEMVWNFQTKFYLNMDAVLRNDHAIFSRFLSVEIASFVLLFFVVVSGLFQIARESRTSINSLSLLPVDSCFNNMQIRSQMMMLENY